MIQCRIVCELHMTIQTCFWKYTITHLCVAAKSDNIHIEEWKIHQVTVRPISQSDKRTDYPGKEVATKIQIIWDQDFDKQIEFVTGDEWKAGNISYHLKSRPKWEGFTNNEILDNSSQFICVDDICLGRY